MASDDFFDGFSRLIFCHSDDIFHQIVDLICRDGFGNDYVLDGSLIKYSYLLIYPSDGYNYGRAKRYILSCVWLHVEICFSIFFITRYS